MTRFRVLFFCVAWLGLMGGASAFPPQLPVPFGEKSPLTPSGVGDGKKVGALFLAMCVDHFGRGELTWAEQACSQAVEANPREVDAYKLRGYIFLLGHRFEQAARDFRVALGLRPGDDQEIAGYGQSLSGLGKFPAAAVQFHKALAIAPQKAAYWNGLCWALAGEGRMLQAALKSCNRALDLMPGAAGTLNSRAMVYLHMRRFAPAITDYSASLKVQPDQASAWFGRGLARLALAQEDGVQDILEGRRRDPSADEIFVQMGVLSANCPAMVKSGPRCPKGFPRAQQKQPGDYLTVSLHADPDQELAADIKVTRADLNSK